MTAQTDTLIEISGLKFSYNSLDVLKGLDLAVPRGKDRRHPRRQRLRQDHAAATDRRPVAAGRRFRPVDGQVIHELDTNALYEVRRKMGMMFQQGGLFTDLSTFENIAFPMRERTDLPDELIHDMVLMKLHSVGLRGAWPLMPSELSGGMARRVALSRAIAMDPMLIMYDEPFSGLDPISLTQIGNLIRGLNDALGVTSIVVTYDVAESLKVVDYAYFISDGRIVAQGTPDEIRASTDPFVRQFVDGQADGPVAFHMPAKPLAEEFSIS
jgi:phospholipid/cholesterol/gamma-HCH transport system ATP-binding protein